MIATDLYQDFGTDPGAGAQAAPSTSDEFEEAKLQAFENGYQAGWDDLTKAQSNLELTISSTLATNLQEASFQYHEMRNQLTRTTREIVKGIVESILPNVAQQSLGLHIVQLVEAHTRDALEREIQICVPETALDRVERLLPESPVSFALVADPKLPPDQASLRLGETEHAIDLGRVISDLGAAVDAYFETQISEEEND